MDTIVAIATSPGRSAIGVVRVSGAASLCIARHLIADESFTPEPRKVFLKNVVTGSGEVLDSALITYFQSPHSFTGEDMIELSCHGSPLILRRLLDRAQSCGARLAEAGEFTLRACRNGKLNLSQAEAIRDLIDARTEVALAQATRQLKGELSNRLQPAKEKLVRTIVVLESALEFVEDDLPEFQWQEIKSEVATTLAEISSLASTFERGQVVRDGISATLVGRPNAGKSSLFNSLLGFDRAIVTDVPGTTRDTISDSLTLEGVPVSLTDTAGIRDAENRIEEIGVARTHRASADADVLIVVIDSSEELGDDDLKIIANAQRVKHVIALNKIDLPAADSATLPMQNGSRVVHVSALTGKGLDELRAAILDQFGKVEGDTSGFLITDSRHYDLLRRAASSLEDALKSIETRASEEIALVGLHNALRYLGEITGETTSQAILSQIFKTFCIGK
jgi:tRNA modification GTPase